jgi:hypothetical protein
MTGSGSTSSQRGVRRVEQEMDFIRLLTYDLFSLNFPVYDFMLIPSFTEPYAYHVKIRIGLQCVKPEIYNDFAEFNFFDSRIIIMQGSRLEIKMSIHKDRISATPAIAKYLLKLIHVLCYEQPS